LNPNLKNEGSDEPFRLLTKNLLFSEFFYTLVIPPKNNEGFFKESWDMLQKNDNWLITKLTTH